MFVTAAIYILLQVAFIGAVDPGMLAKTPGMELILRPHLQILQSF